MRFIPAFLISCALATSAQAMTVPLSTTTTNNEGSETISYAYEGHTLTGISSDGSVYETYTYTERGDISTHTQFENGTVIYKFKAIYNKKGELLTTIVYNDISYQEQDPVATACDFEDGHIVKYVCIFDDGSISETVYEWQEV